MMTYIHSEIGDIPCADNRVSRIVSSIMEANIPDALYAAAVLSERSARSYGAELECRYDLDIPKRAQDEWQSREAAAQEAWKLYESYTGSFGLVA